MRDLAIRALRWALGLIERGPMDRCGFSAQLHRYGQMAIVRVEVGDGYGDSFFAQLKWHLSVLGHDGFNPNVGRGPGSRYFGPTSDLHSAQVALKLYEEFARDDFRL